MSKKIVLSGIQATGKLTLGNYLGVLKHLPETQDEGEPFIFIADLHALTLPIDPEELRQNSIDIAAFYLAAGLDPNKSTLFLQSSVSAHAELNAIMQNYLYMGELSRMTQFKDKTTKMNDSAIGLGIFAYPVLMACDIILYDANIVPVGEDQVQHVELTRDLAQRFNNKYGDSFVVPEPLIAKIGARIMSLQDPSKKMSKSDDTNKGCIYLLDDIEVARKKIMSAVTDSIGKVQLDKENQPGLYNLIEIASSLSGISMSEIALQFENEGYGKLKAYVADIVCDKLKDIQDKYQEIINSRQIEEILIDGANRANKIADKKLEEIKNKIGLEIKY